MKRTCDVETLHPVTEDKYTRTLVLFKEFDKRAKE